MKNKVFLTIFAVLFAALSLLTLLLPKKDFSPTENRMLAEFHAPDGKSLADDLSGVYNVCCFQRRQPFQPQACRFPGVLAEHIRLNDLIRFSPCA